MNVETTKAVRTILVKSWLDMGKLKIQVAGKTVTIEEFAIDALGGHAKIAGTFELDDSLTGAFSFEGPHDPFFPIVLAAHETERIQLGTAIAVAFARNPMICAQVAQDLQRISRGRFYLGLGAQIRPHIERRFSQPWSRPAARMREFVRAIRAIWHTWSTGEKLDFRGEFYTHTLMTPFFNPGPNPFGDPPIFLAAVGPHMVEVAGEVADGLLIHPLCTPEFIEKDLQPALDRGLARGVR